MRASPSHPSRTRRIAFAAALTVVLVALASRCTRSDDNAPAVAIPDAASPTARPASAPPSAPVTQAQAATQARRQRAVIDAVDLVHAYLQALGAGEFERADGFWQANRAPAPQDEAGLRQLGPLRALRMQNRPPALPPGSDMPATLEVPVELVAHVEGAVPVRAHGYYRVRRDPVRARWEITAAALQPVID